MTPPPPPPPPGPLQPLELPVGERRLRPWREDDVETVWLAFQDPHIQLWNGGGVASRTDALVLLGRRMDWSSGDHASWVLVEPAADEALASVSLHSIDRLQGDAEIGYWTAPAARGRGFAPAAVDAVCRWAFGALPVDRIELCHAVENTASRRVAEKAGFTYEGRLRRSYRYGDGVKHDELLWARLADDPAPG
ncbi:GNAT family N-acetyltransferase [Blastococcus capsensis]|uniref:GNAT family N-acetyltransferase n=1 Tax=Blastococcus capsensis TaxID=1564163 RepID=UPI0025413E5A|nr:GNAT family N-acetyltransferase [Blastococcus capsensis]MDK3255056.1 GNAT family N-acetyltransferase [Blastococcus capsensis]